MTTGAVAQPIVQPPRLILASGSKARAAMLEGAGVAVRRDPADVDEGALKATCRAQGATVEATAETLAEAKARHVAQRHPGAFVLGADQMLECGGDWFDKPGDRDGARAQLARLRGRSHRLVSAAVIVRDGERLWRHTDAATLAMRPFSDAFLAQYLDACGEVVQHSVGAYHLEGLGAQLFDRVDGDFFTILGLPLLPVLGFLRDHGILTE
ncbi:Maf family protein [Azospirillum sp.]|uniref:Maf family protein n=1 Tax=Azospirillum sp. TaxID=34012 RepID=UPI0039C894D0